MGGHKYCAQHQKPRKNSPHINDNYMDSAGGRGQDDDKDTRKKKKAPIRTVAELKKTATKSAPTKTSARKVAPAEASASELAAKNKVV